MTNEMLRRFYIVLLGLLLCVGCTQDTTLDASTAPEGAPVDMVLRFGAPAGTNVVVSRQTMPEQSDESKVWNLYVFLFDADGNKIYGRYFDGSEALESEAAVTSSTTDAWYVSVPEGDEYRCEGVVKIKTIARPNCKIFAIANIDSQMYSFSPETFQLIQHENDLLNLVVKLNQQFIERSGFFPMTGELSPVNTASLSGTLRLKRLDAKVRFWVQIGSDAIKSLAVEKWQVVNASADTYLMGRDVREKYGVTTSDSGGEYFDSPTKNVEVEEVYDGAGTTTTEDDKTRYGFSFYLLENALTPKKTPRNYADRERQVKGADGKNGAWEYANDHSTYVVLTAHVEMDTSYALSDEIYKEGCTLNATVQYIIHLGDFKNSGAANFATDRNTSYTYTVKVNGVNDIRVEVETSNDNTDGVTENAPGATGEVTIALQEIFHCDAHYSSHVMKFHHQYIKPDKITWYVRTPFSEGKPVQVNGTDMTTGLDFRWVEFRLNERWNNIYSDNRELYKPHSLRRDENGNPYAAADGKTLYVDELVRYLREQKYAYDAGERNDFDDNGEIKLTAFVNEYYYDEHPITGAKDLHLWKQVVNQDQMRLMHILSDSYTSADGESTVVGSSYTIQQQSIQSVYNEHADGLDSAWGMEHIDDYPNLTYNSAGTGTNEQRGNTEAYNGRLNTLREWGLVGASNTTYKNTVRWDEYLNLTATNEMTAMHTAATHPRGRNYEYLRYSCMSRNRDNNGDGIINAGEVRWYLASIRQLVGIWMGADGVDNTARLYQRNAQQKASDDERDWRQHVVSSTTGSNSNNPTIVWAEEGSSTGDLSGSTQWGRQTAWSVRCVRNLGMDDSDDAVITDVPQDYVQVNKPGDGGTDAKPVFDLEFLNEKSIRYLSGMDLVYSDELSPQNRLYWKFEATSVNSPSYNAITFSSMQAELDRSLGTNRFCPAGYRLPNQRELGLMHLYCASSFWDRASQSYSRTYYSYGAAGSNPKPTECEPNNPYDNDEEQFKIGWARDGSNIYMENSTNNGNQRSTATRCVRDVAVGTN